MTTIDPADLLAKVDMLRAADERAKKAKATNTAARILYAYETGEMTPETESIVTAALKGDTDKLRELIESGPAAIGTGSGTSSGTPTPGGKRSKFAPVVLSNPDGTVKTNAAGDPVPDSTIMQVLWNDDVSIASFGLIETTLPDGSPAYTRRPTPPPPPDPTATTTEPEDVIVLDSKDKLVSKITKATAVKGVTDGTYKVEIGTKDDPGVVRQTEKSSSSKLKIVG